MDGWIVDGTTGEKKYPVMMEAAAASNDLASGIAQANGAPFGGMARSSSALVSSSPLYWLAALVLVIFALGLFKHR